MYAVLQLDRQLKINVMGITRGVTLSYAEGMIGAMPVFKLKKDAKKFAGKKCDIIQISIDKSRKE